METKNFFETYFREVGFVVLAVFVAGGLMVGADAQTVNGSIYGVAGLILLFMLLCAGTIVLGQSVITSSRLGDVKLVTAVCTLAILCGLLAYSCCIQQAFAIEDAIKIACCGIIDALFCGLYLDWRADKIRDFEFLLNNNPDKYLAELVRQKRILDEDQQLKLMDLPDAERLLYAYMQYEDLTSTAEQKLIGQVYAWNLIRHLPKYCFTDSGAAYLFGQENAAELVLQYVKNGNSFCYENELKMFSLPNAEEVVTLYASKHRMSKEAADMAKAKGWL